MARLPSVTMLGLDAVTIEGGLIASEQVQAIAGAPATPKRALEYDCPRGTSLNDEITRYFRMGQALWRDYDQLEGKTLEQTREFVRNLLERCFGFERLSGPVEHDLGNRHYHLAWEGKEGRVPVVVAAPVAGRDAFNCSMEEFGDGAGGNRPRRSPVSLLQDWLNTAEEALWGLVFAGDRVRLMRDNASLTRPAWIEADLGAIFGDEKIADFTIWWLLAHATCFGSPEVLPSDCRLEHWRDEGLRQGEAARADLYENVRDALDELGKGALEANASLRRSLLSHDQAALEDFFEELLRTVYRLIFLAVAEDRDLLQSGRVTREARKLYRKGYSFAFWRKRAQRHEAYDGYHDAWEAMKVTFRSLGKGEDRLGLPALGGLFAAGVTPVLDGAHISNRRFLAAMRRLGFIRREGAMHRINWRDLRTEELGSVYEGLLELTPRLNENDDFVLEDSARGNARKTSGSYYTPDSLVETLLDSALNPVLHKAVNEAVTVEDKIAALLDLKIIDPACGSGHFLLGAARRVAERVARLRNEDAGKEEMQAALRDVVSRCIHGVDRNPMAVELAKVALWIESVSPGQPLGFLDGNIVCGDALLGVFDLKALEGGIPKEAYKPLTGDAKPVARYYQKVNNAALKGQGAFDFSGAATSLSPGRLVSRLDRIRRMPENTVGQVEKKRSAWQALRDDPAQQHLRQACDLYVAAFLLPKTDVPSSEAENTVPTTRELWGALAEKATGGASLPAAMGDAVTKVIQTARPLHWPLVFSDIMLTREGFDVVLGNPPWERVKLQEQEFFAGTSIAEAPNASERKRRIADWASREEGSAERKWIERFGIAKRLAEASALFYTSPKPKDPAKPGPACRYPWTGRGDVNTYALFTENFLNLMRDRGRAGIIVPTGIATDATTAPFFGHVVGKGQLASLFDFENRLKLFPSVDSRMKFCLLTTGTGIREAEFAFYLDDPTQLEDERCRFTLTPEQIARINPNTRTAPVFRSREDARLAEKIYARVPVLMEEGRDGGNPWELSFMTMFHMSNDSSFFRTVTQLEEKGLQREGRDWAGAGKHRYVPLYEAKMIHQYDYRWATYDGDKERDATDKEKEHPDFEPVPRYWVPQDEVNARLAQKDWKKDWLLGWRGIARATDERTVISMIFPRAGVGNSMPVIFFGNLIKERVIACLVGNLSSLILDYIARFKVGGTNLNFFIFEQFPVLPPSAYSEDDLAFIVPRVLELTYTSEAMAPFARDLGYEGAPYPWDEARRAGLRAELDAWYALAYGLERDELQFVLDPAAVRGEDYPSKTFPILKKKETKEFGEYRTQRLVLAAYDALRVRGKEPFRGSYR